MNYLSDEFVQIISGESARSSSELRAFLVSHSNMLIHALATKHNFQAIGLIHTLDIADIVPNDSINLYNLYSLHWLYKMGRINKVSYTAKMRRFERMKLFGENLNKVEHDYIKYQIKKRRDRGKQEMVEPTDIESMLSMSHSLVLLKDYLSSVSTKYPLIFCIEIDSFIYRSSCIKESPDNEENVAPNDNRAKHNACSSYALNWKRLAFLLGVLNKIGKYGLDCEIYSSGGKGLEMLRSYCNPRNIIKSSSAQEAVVLDVSGIFLYSKKIGVDNCKKRVYFVGMDKSCLCENNHLAKPSNGEYVGIDHLETCIKNYILKYCN